MVGDTIAGSPTAGSRASNRADLALRARRSLQPGATGGPRGTLVAYGALPPLCSDRAIGTRGAEWPDQALSSWRPDRSRDSDNFRKDGRDIVIKSLTILSVSDSSLSWMEIYQHIYHGEYSLAIIKFSK